MNKNINHQKIHTEHIFYKRIGKQYFYLNKFFFFRSGKKRSYVVRIVSN